jgi:3-methyladenine DNA glycosylase AlkC
MPSISSKTAIRERFSSKCNMQALEKFKSVMDVILQFQSVLKSEYDIIPEKERIGKGSVFIAKTVGNIAYDNLVGVRFCSVDPYDFIQTLILFGENQKDRNLYNLGLVLLGYHMSSSLKNLRSGFSQLSKYATHSNWEIREMSGFGIREALKMYPDDTFVFLNQMIRKEDPNLRRIVIESLRPLADIKWLRDPDKNSSIFVLLRVLRSDPSVYVRKSVGNNLKDLSKYMPETILDLAEHWVNDAAIKVTKDLASKSKKELGSGSYFLIWTLKHALRWLRARNPEYHGRIEQIMGINYILYFDEKKNKLALPRTSENSK